MRKILLFPLLFLLFSFAPFVDNDPNEGRISTRMNGKIENWDVVLGNDEGTFEGYLMNDPNRWTFSIGKLEGEVNTEFNDAYNSWEITVSDKTYHLKTWLSNSWSRWELSGGELKEKTSIRTLYQGSYDNWQLTRDSIDVDITTYTNNSWDDWQIKGDLQKITDGEKIASLFIPVFVSRIYKRNIVH